MTSFSYSPSATIDELAGWQNADAIPDNNYLSTDEPSFTTTRTQKPLFRALAVFGVVGCISIILALILGSIISKPEQNGVTNDSQDPETMLDPVRDKLADFKADAALGRQADDLEDLQNPPAEQNSAPPQPVPQRVQPTPRQTVTQPRIVRAPAPPIQAQPIINHAAPQPAPQPATAVVAPTPNPAIASQSDIPDIETLDITLLERPAVAEAIEEEGNDPVVLRPGAQAIATVESTATLTPDLPLRFSVLLTEPLMALDGSEALPISTVLMAELIFPSANALPYLTATSIVTNSEEIAIPINSLFLLSEQQFAPIGEQPINPDIDWNSVALTGLAAVFDGSEQEVLAGLALDIAGQLLESRPTPDASISEKPVLTIEAGTQVIVHVNSSVSLDLSHAEFNADDWVAVETDAVTVSAEICSASAVIAAFNSCTEKSAL